MSLEWDYAEERVAWALRLCGHDGRRSTAIAEQVFSEPSVQRSFVADVLHAVLDQAIDHAAHTGWLPFDLVQVVSRQVAPGAVPTLVEALLSRAERSGSEQAAPGWMAGLADLAGDRTGSSSDGRCLGPLLGVTAVLRVLTPLPALPARTSAPADSSVSKHLARVRALLAKAESTTFSEEADALATKAQELISRYSLTQLIEPGPDHGVGAVVARRHWIDAPYVGPKYSLIAAVARANHTAAVFSPGYGFATLIGPARDVDAVDLLVTSLLTQAEIALRRQPDQRGGQGPSRAKSYRRAFWFSFAGRIGQRLTDAADSATREFADERLLPVLAAQADRVEAMITELFPVVRTSRRATVTNLAGWAAGKAAADLAGISADPRLAADPG